MIEKVQASVVDVKRDLPAYLELVEAGKTVVILEAGNPVAEIRSIPQEPEAIRPFGLCAGQFSIPDDFDDPLPDHIIEAFEGR